MEPTRVDRKVEALGPPQQLRRYLRRQFGAFWRRKVRLYLVLGEVDQVERLLPDLVEKQWLVGHDTVLLWGGSLQNPLDQVLMKQWRMLSRARGVHGALWVLDQDPSSDAAVFATSTQRLRVLARYLGWRLPVHLWQVRSSGWPQPSRPEQAVGCRLPPRATAENLEAQLSALLQPLRQLGIAQMQSEKAHDFLLRLARDLEVDGAAHWRRALHGVLDKPDGGVLLRGVWFSLAQPRVKEASDNHHGFGPAWDGVLNDRAIPPRRVGCGPRRIGYVVILTLAAVWGAGMLISFASNRAEIGRVEQALAALQQPAFATDPLGALGELARELSRQDYRAEHGAPWYQRFGLDRSEALRDVLWPHYVQAGNQLLRDPAAASLQAQLRALVTLPPGSPERAKRAQEAYAQLKAYLMLARPEKADAAFLVQTLGAEEPALWKFYSQQLPANPDWAIEADPKLIAQVRQVLLAQLGQRNAETSLYQQILDTAANHYPALDLQHMVGETDAKTLFATTASVPGVFTRQAWEGQVRPAIAEAAKARREEIDWVLSDSPADIAAELSPAELEARLTARYFQDYSRAWLDFLNSLRWQQRKSLDEVIAQLTLMSDARHSPLIALMNTLAYQGQAGIRGQALADSLIKSAQNLMGQDKTALIDQRPQSQAGPLDSTFGPLLALLGKHPDAQSANDDLSLQAFLIRVTSVRLKLQQVTSAADPQAMTQALAQTVFQGKQVDLTDTRAYGSLIAASLGAEWGRAAQTLFVQPLEHAWQRVLQPSAVGLNREWQRAIVDPWQGAFAGRYPFAATSSDASLPMLGKMIRADSGRIEQFLREQLSGLLRKEGSRWVADPRNGQGLRFNPEFLAAINQLGHLADVLYTDGGMGLSFELRGKPVRDVVQTTFMLNGEIHHYFNQRERWQRFRWPGLGEYPGTRLTWTSVDAGERLFADYEGTWGLIRLLEQAQVTALNDGDSHFRLVIKAPDGIGLTWNLRTELGMGPLALLTLRDFNLPLQIFMVEGGNTPALAHIGSVK
nr:ImcF-related family protein [Pseudomonas reidholzensis]